MKTAKYFASVLVGLTLVVAAAPAMAMQMEDGTSMKGDKLEKRVEMSNEKATCMKPAVLVREDSMAASLSTFSSAMSSAMTARRAALEAAYSTTESKTRRDGIQKAWDTFRSARKTARETFNTSGKAVWSAFRASVKNCKGEVTNESSKTEASESL